MGRDNCHDARAIDETPDTLRRRLAAALLSRDRWMARACEAEDLLLAELNRQSGMTPTENPRV